MRAVACAVALWVWSIPGMAPFVTELDPHTGPGALLLAGLVARLGRRYVRRYVRVTRWWGGYL